VQKDYQQWHTQKSDIECREERLYFHERQIWFCRLGANVGFEQDGRGELFLRPVVILKKFSPDTFWGIPLSTRRRGPSVYHFLFSFRSDVMSIALLPQLRLFDAKRLHHFAGNIGKSDFESVKKQIRRLLA
jgi:mRNA interferase MazF